MPVSRSEIIGGLTQHRLGRRDVNRLLAGAGLAMVMLPVSPAQAHPSGELSYFGWAGYDDESFHAAYAAKHGGPPEFVFWASEDEAFRRMHERGFAPDVMNPCSDNLVKWQRAGLLRPLDPARLEHLGDLLPGLGGVPGAIIGGRRYFMPLDWGNSTVVYRTDLVDAGYQEEHSWNILFDERYRGRLATYGSAGAVIQVAALVLGYRNVFSLTGDQLAEVRRKITAQRDLLRFYWSSSREADRALSAGDIVASYAWNDTFATLRRQGVPIGLMVPREGILTWCCGLVMHSRTRRVNDAYDLINTMTSPESGAAQIAGWGYGHANRKAFGLVPEETLEALGLSAPEALVGNGIFYDAIDPATEETYIRLFEEVKAGA